MRTPQMHGFPFAEPAWLAVLRAFCAVAEGADVLVPAADTADIADAEAETGFASKSAKCVAAVLGDALRRLSMIGGRDGMPRSMGSVFGYSVARFAGGGLRGGRHHVIPTPVCRASINGVAVSRDGTTLLVSYRSYMCLDGVSTFSVETGAHLRTIGCLGRGPLQFRHPCQIWIAPDDFVYVADCYNNRVQVLTPQLGFHSFVGKGQLDWPSGVCGDDGIIAVSENTAHRVSVFRRADGALLRRFGSFSKGQLYYPHGLCFMGKNRQIAVADHDNHRISVFSLEGEFVRTVGVGELRSPTGVACSAFDELVVADSGNNRVVVFRASGEILNTMGNGVSCFIDVAIYGGAIFAQTSSDEQCVVLT